MNYKTTKGGLVKFSILARRVIVIALPFVLICGLGYAQNDKAIYSEAIKAARAGEPDFAYLYFREVLSDFPSSRYREGALFATGEYYFNLKDHSDAIKAFIQFVSDYPDSKTQIFALAYIFKITQILNLEAVSNYLKTRIINSQRLIFVFKEFKELKYNSPSQKKYKAIYFIDKIEIYLDGELFEKITF